MPPELAQISIDNILAGRLLLVSFLAIFIPVNPSIIFKYRYACLQLVHAANHGHPPFTECLCVLAKGLVGQSR